MTEGINERCQGKSRRNKQGGNQNDPPGAETVIQFAHDEQSQRKDRHVDKKDGRDGPATPAEFGNDGFHHHAKGIAGTGVEKKNPEGSGDDIPAIEKTIMLIVFSQESPPRGVAPA